MLSDEILQRFARIGLLYGFEGLKKLTQAHVCVIGVGGVGSWATESLARSAVGKLTIIDMDSVCLTNTNRQIHALDKNYGKPKVEVMKERILAINPACIVEPLEVFLSKENLSQLITSRFDLVIDAIDSVQSKAALIAHCKRSKIPLIVSGGAGGKTNPSYITSGDLAKACYDPLLAKIRNILRRDYGFSKNVERKFGIESVYSTQQLLYPQADGSVSHAKPCANGEYEKIANFGTVTMVTASFGLRIASRVVEKLLA